MEHSNIRLMKERRYEMIPIDQIVVVNSRSREKSQFKENVRSIGSVGLYKPILVNKRNFARMKKYELICGEGRLLAHRELRKTEIKAEVIDIDEKTAQLMTLGENIARTRMASMEFARAIKEMSDMGMRLEQLSAITGKTQEYVRSYIRLMEQGEERLIKGVEDGIFTMNFALNVAQSSDRSVQHLLMDAFDNGIVTTTNMGRVRRIVEDRLQKGRSLSSKGKRSEAPYTVDKLKSDIRQITRQKEAFVYEVGQKENRLFRILMALRKLQDDERFVSMLKVEGLSQEPQLKGTYEL
jgi:ParB family chromosome partitioning protein